MGEISGALVGIALVLSAVFLPMAFFSGSTGVIYRWWADGGLNGCRVPSTIFYSGNSRGYFQPRVPGGEWYMAPWETPAGPGCVPPRGALVYMTLGVVRWVIP